MVMTMLILLAIAFVPIIWLEVEREQTITEIAQKMAQWMARWMDEWKKVVYFNVCV